MVFGFFSNFKHHTKYFSPKTLKLGIEKALHTCVVLYNSFILDHLGMKNKGQNPGKSVASEEEE